MAFVAIIVGDIHGCRDPNCSDGLASKKSLILGGVHEVYWRQNFWAPIWFSLAPPAPTPLPFLFPSTIPPNTKAKIERIDH
jgi:hypothetical protein